MTERVKIQKGKYSNRLALLLMVALITIALVACDSQSTQKFSGEVDETGTVHEFVFEGFMDGYYGVGGDIDGVKNPTLLVDVGDQVTIKLINGERMPHDIAMKSHDVISDMLIRPGEEASITFIAQGNDTYYCTVPGHEAAGMVGSLEVRGVAGGEPVSMK